LDKEPKRDEQTYFPTQSQLWLLDVCGYKEYNKPPSINSSIEVYQFVNTHFTKKNQIFEVHGKMPIPSLSIFCVLISFFIL
jgi:hypothetical protein